ncbi:MAG: TetR-like C-terminal domain-containing protein, partial [Streptosporangiaceae bacterium]
DLLARHRPAPSHDGARRALLLSQPPGSARCPDHRRVYLAGRGPAGCPRGAGARLPGGQWLALCRAHRAWALDHQAEYLLLYGHADTDAAKRRNPQVGQAFSGVVSVLCSAIGEIAAAGQIDTERIEAATPASLRRQLASWRDENGIGGGFPVGALAAYMIACTQLYGAITLEVLGHVPPAFADHGALFDLEMVHAFAGVCRPLPPEGIGGPRRGPWAAGQLAG